MPSSPQTVSLTTALIELPGVGPRRAAALRRMGLRCVADLILHIPSRYEEHMGERTAAEVAGDVGPDHGASSSASLSVRGEIHTTRQRPGGRSRFEATLFDGTGTVLLTWFNAPWMKQKLHPGMTIRAWGKAKRFGDYLQLVNPQWEMIAIEAEVAGSGEHLSPIYPASEEVTSVQIARLVDGALDQALACIEDHLPATFRNERALVSLPDAYRMVHRPRDEDEVLSGRRRLAFDELFMQQLGVMLRREARRSSWRAIALPHSEAIAAHIEQRFPFDLTASQRVVIEEITRDIGRDSPMNRLLQGDVGSGKTVVALYALLMAIAAGHQGALLAPTELLAEQHFSTIAAMLEGSRVDMTLLSGSLTAKLRGERLERIERGEVDLVIGTHALLSKGVRFSSLAVAVVDEQHRFGVEQRSLLRTRSNEENLAAHTLIMTATPIPRTLSLTLFGDLDVSTIRGMPPGRTPIATRIMSEQRAGEVYQHLRDRIARGEQAYVVVPVIDESDAGLKDVHTHLEYLQTDWLPDAKLAAMHGRLSRDERERIMNDFRSGAIDALIATTVIEVGVDVPNATMMVVEHADRFGLAQLHQLRGRVGRGGKRSVCVLLSDPATDVGKARLNALADSSDGFAIAERDLEIRGPGELFGTRQSGAAPFRVAELPRDVKLLELARRDAQAWIEANPALAGDDLALLRRRLRKSHGDGLGLADVG
ncbi:MAG: ATP-dependent DNA helicase RecG [Phycisphaerales bacterium]